jgi:hypothetical protein
LTATIKVPEPVTRVSTNPWNNLTIATSGDKFIKVWKLQDSIFQGTYPVTKKDVQNYTDHLWLAEHLIAACNDIGDIQIISDGSVRQVLSGFMIPEKVGLSCMRATSKVRNQ